MTRLFLAVLLTSFQVFRGSHFLSNVMHKNEVNNKDALCNDGSQAVYYLGVQNPSKWIIFLESGSYCLTKGQCSARFGSKNTNILMTSKGMPNSISGRDLLSTNSKENELFYSYSRVLIPYCSSDSWLGTQTKSKLHNTQNKSAVKQFIFSGEIIFQSVIVELLSQPLQQANEILFVGSSAGGVGVLNHVTWLKERLLSRNITANVSAIIDGGWFINFRQSIASKVTKDFFKISERMSHACADFTRGYPCCLSAPCMIAQGYYPSDVPTLFVFSMFDLYIIADAIHTYVNRILVAENGANDLLTVIDLYGGAMNQSVFVANSPNVSFFVAACFQHTYFSMSSLREKGGVLHYNRMFTQGNSLFRTSKRPGTWLSTAIRRGNKTLTLHSALLNWAKSRDHPIKVIDSCLGAMCNPTCPDKLTFVDNAVYWSGMLNGVVLFMSLIATVVCVVLRISFMIYSLLLRQEQIQCLKRRKSSEPSAWKHVEPIKLQYSTPDSSTHFELFQNPEEMKESNKEKFESLREKQLPKEYSAKGYNVMFYRTVQYLWTAFGGKRENCGRKKSYYRLDSERDNFHADRSDSECKENFKGAHVDHGFEELSDDQNMYCRDFPTHGIHNANLRFKRGELVAVAGTQGAGKSTLLQLLSGRMACGCGQQHVLVNGADDVQDSYAGKIAYLAQFTYSYDGELTLKEYLTLATLMRFSSNVSHVVERVEQILCETNLTSAADKTFGVSFKMNLTKLQERFLCIALQLIKRPVILFLDEPIAGLNKASSLEMLHVLRRLCDNGHLVIVTVKSISKKTAQLFDQLVLLNNKEVVYSGNPDSLMGLSKSSSEDTNEENKESEDTFSDVLQIEKMIEAVMAYECLKKGGERDATQPVKTEENDFTPQNSCQESSGLLARLFVLDYRNSLSTTLGQSLYLPIMFSFFGLTAGIVYWEAGTPLHVITAYCGASMPSLLFLGSVIVNRINRSLEMRQMASAEDAGYPHEHLIHTFMSTSAACVLPVLVCSALTYFMVITSYNWWRFFLVTLISLVLNQTWISVYMMMTYANPRYATQVNLMAAILAGFAGGFIVTKPQMPIGYNLLFYINPQLFGYSAIAKVILQNIRLKCEFESPLNCISKDGNAVLARFVFHTVNPYENLTIMLCITLSCLLFSWFLCHARISRCAETTTKDERNHKRISW